MFVSIKSIHKFQISGIKHTQLCVFFNTGVNVMTDLNHALLDNTWYYLSKTGRVKTIQLKKSDYSVSCTVNNKAVFMTAIKINGKLTPVFQPIEKKLVYEDLIIIPER